MRHFSLILLLTLWSCLSISVQAADYETRKDIEFAKPGGVSLKLDAYLLKGEAHPAIIFVHGGGFTGGDKGHVVATGKDLFDPLIDNGFSVLSINYRLAPKHPYPAATLDVAAAISYIKKNAKHLRVDPDRLALIGPSAGGMIVSHAGAKYKKENRVRAVVSMFGEHDFELRVTENPCAMDGHTVPRPAGGCISGGMAAFLGFAELKTDKQRALLRDAACVQHVHKTMPAYLLIHGTRDYGVPIEQAHSMEQAMKRVGADCTLMAIVGGGHGSGGDWHKTGPGNYREKMIAWLKQKMK